MVTTTVEGRERFGVIVRYRVSCAVIRSASPRTSWCRRRDRRVVMLVYLDNALEALAAERRAQGLA